MDEIFRAAVYILCFATSSACAVLLGRSYTRTQVRLLLWSAICFAFLALNNLAVVVDLLLIPETSLQIPRLIFSACAVAVLLFGLIFDAEERL